ncbi:apolipophorins [Caerostris extrusa]|uniref:Apolipophorins n=1 Tax=Caerostris extrusa TaxID=172846 RepID=A0AAV4T317_CAEEX|nr:apolipophorins [Caerostris extrusa]
MQNARGLLRNLSKSNMDLNLIVVDWDLQLQRSSAAHESPWIGKLTFGLHRAINKKTTLRIVDHHKHSCATKRPLIASTVAVPVQQGQQCARYCSSERDFRLDPGTSYTYDYETTIVTTVQGGSQDKTQLQITAQAIFEVLDRCELSLRLRGVTLKQSDPESPDYLVSSRGAREFARALERPTLRFSFQNGQVEHTCPLENTPTWVTNIQKGVLSAFQTHLVKPDASSRHQETDVLGKCTAEYQSLGIQWHGTHTIRKVKDLSSCTERENVETYLQGSPYSSDFQTQSLPVVTGNQECEQVFGDGYLQTSTCNEKLVFRPFSNRGNGVVTTVSQKLIHTSIGRRKPSGLDYRPTTEPLLFSHENLEVSSAKIEEETETSLKELCEAAQTDISITVPRKFSAFIYKLKKLNLRSLKAFYQKTDKICSGSTKARKFFMDAIPLVSTAESARFMYDMISRKSISETESNFWLTSLSFIKETTPEIIATFTPLLDGRYNQAILGISALIRNYCQDKDCSAVSEVQSAVILSLKAIGNIGYMFGKESLIEACYKNPQIRTETRLAAIDAFRRVSCDISREELMKTYSNYNEETEMRIAAYLAVMKCPTLSTIQEVKEVLLNERINHVGSFIWTHLNALSKTKHPERREIRDIVYNLYLMNKFASDLCSTLTVDIFGKSCNLFQIDGRAEGLEQVVEQFFGPGGYFPQKNIAKILREKRSVDNNKLNQIDSRFKEHYKNQVQPYGSVDVKVFGTSMWYEQFRSDDGTPDINLLDIVTKLAEENEKEYSRSFTFLDTTFTVPLTSGLPLKIALNGTASVGLKIAGKFDVKSFEHVDVHGHIEPRNANPQYNAFIFRFGRKGASQKGEVVKAQLNMPRDRIDVFNIQSKLYIVHGAEEREKTTDKKRRNSPPELPNAPLQPFNGPASFSIFIQKTDPTLKSYNFDAQWKTELKDGGFIKQGLFSLNTPESKVDRDVRMEFYLNQADRTVALKVKTPVKKFGVNAKLLDNESQKKLDFSINVDDKDYFSLQSDLGIETGRNSVVYTPSLEITIPSGRWVYVSGSADLRHGQKYSGHLKIENLTEKPILAKGNFEVGKKNRYEIEASLNSFPLDGTLKGFAQLGDNLSSRITAEYKILEGKMNKLSIVGKVRNLSVNALTKYTGSLNIQASVLPEWNTELVFETMKTTGHMENTVSVSFGDGARSRVHTIKLQEILTYEGSLSNNKVDGSFKLLYPERNINYGISMKHENTEHSLKNTLEIQYDTNRKINTEVQLKKSSGDLLSVAGDVKLRYPGRETGLQVELAQSSNKEYRATASCQWQRGRQVAVVLHYKDKCEGYRLKYEIDGTMNLPESSPIAFATIVGYNRGQFAGSAEVSKGVDKYRAKVDVSAGYGLNHRMSGQFMVRNHVYGIDAAINNVKDKINGNVELKMPNNYRMVAKFEGRNGESMKVGSFETHWDADRDTSKRFIINGELRNQAEGYDGKVVMQIRRRTIKGALSTSLQGNLFSSQFKTNNKIELEWSPTEKVTGVLSSNVILERSRQQLGSHIEITTPYYGFENISLGLTHMYTNQQWDSELSTLLPYGNDITLSSTGKYSFERANLNIETSAKILTSYYGFEDTSVAVMHNSNFKELSERVEVKWGRGKRVFYQISGMKQSSALRGSLKLNTLTII